MSLPLPPLGYQLLGKTEQERMDCISDHDYGWFTEWRPKLLSDSLRWNEHAARWEPGPFHFVWYHDTYAIPERGADLRDL